MAARDIKAGRAFVEVSADNDPLRKTLLQGTAILRSWGTSLKSVGDSISSTWSMIGGPAAVNAITNTVRSLVDLGSELADMSSRTGVAAQDLQFLMFAADQTGTSIETVERALKAMARAGHDVSQFETMGRKIAAITDPSKRAAEALKVFGKSGTDLLPMFEQWNQLKAANAALGPLLTNEEVDRLDRLGDSFGALQESIKRAGGSLVKDFTPELQRAVEFALGLTLALRQGLGKVTLRDLMGTPRGFPKGGSGGAMREVSEFFNLAGIQELGKQALAATADLRKASAAAAEEEAAAQKRITDDAKKQAAETQDILNNAERAGKARTALVREFETPEESFARKQKEIADAIQAVKDSNVFVGTSQAEELAALEESQRRNITRESSRLAREAELAGKRLGGVAEQIRSSSRGATGGAAGVLGRGAPEFGRVEEKQLREQEQTNRHLQEIKAKVGPATFT